MPLGFEVELCLGMAGMHRGAQITHRGTSRSGTHEQRAMHGLHQ